MEAGDGLNDAGALKQSDVGIVIAENSGQFTPGSDAIVDAQQFDNIGSVIGVSKAASRLVIASYVLALIYNVVGLSFAVQAKLSPVIAAILMPLSSLSIVLFGVMGSYLLVRRFF